MQYRRVGNSGLVVSAIGFGCNNLGRPNAVTEDAEESIRVVKAALEAGITYFDTADTYGKTPGLSEHYLGRALGSERANVVIGTKFGMDMNGANGPDFGARGSRRYIITAVEASLRRLNTDYIDLFQYHTPDSVTPIEETLVALDQLIAQGKVRYVGHSNFSGWQIAQAEYVARELGTERFISAQNHYNLMDRRAELEVLPAAEAFHLGVFPYFPLNNGLLTGKYTPSGGPSGSRLSYVRQHMVNDANWDQLNRYAQFAQERGITQVDVAFGWLAAQNPVASVIAGATRVEQVQQNARALDYELSDDDLTVLDEIFPPADKIALY
ncbi:aldo/keto reductase [Enteractinococcus coprophilus]|uniref:Aryl-alcohol dehydrogenase-like predicted oxidoreductase n=1 Tax=Enteractinococcus coprophilus TaxID=1027633 RepID=A0A543AJP8_9MICC|nr:aldo/keto reductase [Enteractinococcus coprophilus]TQL72782.1 aryl-alcohol dehydrogenase-like predicted oxidoreductase [Enteractinococcus coprophilus]